MFKKTVNACAALVFVLHWILIWIVGQNIGGISIIGIFVNYAIIIVLNYASGGVASCRLWTACILATQMGMLFWQAFLELIERRDFASVGLTWVIQIGFSVVLGVPIFLVLLGRRLLSERAVKLKVTKYRNENSRP